MLVARIETPTFARGGVSEITSDATVERAFFKKVCYEITCGIQEKTDESGLVQSEAEKRFESSPQLLQRGLTLHGKGQEIKQEQQTQIVANSDWTCVKTLLCADSCAALGKVIHGVVVSYWSNHNASKTCQVVTCCHSGYSKHVHSSCLTAERPLSQNIDLRPHIWNYLSLLLKKSKKGGARQALM